MALIYIVTVSPSSAHEKETTLGELVDVSSYGQAHVRFVYKGLLTPIVPFTDEPPPPFEATIRADFPSKSPNLSCLFGCKLRASKDAKDAEQGVGSITVMLYRGYGAMRDGQPDRLVKVIFFGAQRQVSIDGRYWDIDDKFWSWLNTSFPFSGIDIHIDKEHAIIPAKGPVEPSGVGVDRNPKADAETGAIRKSP